MTNDRSSLTEYLIVMRAQMGDSKAFNHLFEHYYPRLNYYLRRMVNDEAEDVLQDVWLIVVRRLATLREPEAFRSWLYKIAHNQAISKIRRKKSAGVFVELNDETPVEELLCDENTLFQAYQISDLSRGLEALSLHHKEVLTLRFIESLTYEEIAVVLDFPVGTVRSRIYYAKKSLITYLENQAISKF